MLDFSTENTFYYFFLRNYTLLFFFFNNLHHLTKRDIYRKEVTIEKEAQHLAIREFQIKTTRYQYTSIRMAKLQHSDDIKCWQGCGATGTLINCWWECKIVQSLWKTIWQFLTRLDTLIYYTNMTCPLCSLEFTQMSWKLIFT